MEIKRVTTAQFKLRRCGQKFKNINFAVRSVDHPSIGDAVLWHHRAKAVAVVSSHTSKCAPS